MTLRAAVLTVLMLLTGQPVIANAQSQGIAAIVNDDIISSSDLADRIKLTIVGTGLPDSTETREKIRLQILRAMIDERLQAQEAAKVGVTVTDADMDNAMHELAMQNKLDAAEFVNRLKKDGVPMKALQDQVRAQLGWRGVIDRRLRRQVAVSDQDIDERMARMVASAGRPQYNVGEIFLGVEDSSADSRVRQFADKLVQQIRNGQSFAALARQFSQGAGARNGGALGWIQPGDLPPELNDILVQMNPGSISAPIRTASGYHILAVQNVRQGSAGIGASQIDLRQLGIDAQDGEGDDALLKRALGLRDSLKNCADMDAAIKTSTSTLSVSLGKIALKDLNPQLQKSVINMKAGTTSQPMKMGNAAIILMVCGREMAADGLPARNEIGTLILREKLDMLQRRYLRDLRSAAFIDVRA